jgi:predicted RNA binding protein with dsRBD fold (UPF0201 family)
MTKNHYVNNKDFLAALNLYLGELRDANIAGLAKPQVSEYIGECLIKIATELSGKSNFMNYTFRDEMISDAIENCFVYLDRFDPAKSSNPFGYFTQISYYAFVRRIQKEKKQLTTRYRYIQSMDIDDIIRQIHDDGETGGHLVTYLQKQSDLAKEDAEAVVVPVSVKRKPKYLMKPTETLALG